MQTLYLLRTKTFTLVFVLLCYAAVAQQISNCPASPYPIIITQADGTSVTIIGKGNQLNAWTETLDGYSVVNKNGVYEYARKANGRLVASGMKARNRADRTTAEIEFLQKLPKALKPNAPDNINHSLLKSSPAASGPQKIGYPKSGNVKALLLLIKYPDLSNTYTKANFNNMMNQSNFNGTGSFKDFYASSSFGQLTISTDVFGWYTASENFNYYSAQNGDGRASKLVREAVDAAQAAGVDFSQYDNDGDGVVDGIIVAHAGPGAEEGNQQQFIWSHRWDLSARSNEVTYDGVLIDGYMINPERRLSTNGMVGIGVFCHEFGHNLGLPDLYDSNGGSQGTGEWSLMAGAGWLGNELTPGNFCAWCRTKLGWVTPTPLGIIAGSYSLEAASSSKQVFRINTALPNEYFLLENRQRTGLDEALKGSGLAIWHINTNKTSLYPGSNTVNADENMKGVDLEEADGLKQLDNEDLDNRGDGGDLYPGTSINRNFTNTSTPNSKTYTNASTGITIKNIMADKAGKIWFTYGNPAPVISGFVPSAGGTGTIVTITGNHFLGATSVSFNLLNAYRFTIINATTISAIVPIGATTGKIRVTTPDGTATSATDYTVDGYCVPIYSVAHSLNDMDYINNFSFHTLVRTNSGISNNESNYSNSPSYGPFSYSTQVLPGQSYPISMQAGDGPQSFGVWIDYNNDEDFNDAGEFVYKSPTVGQGIFTGTVTIPSQVTTGLKRMRVRCANSIVSAENSCTPLSFGETEDYTITTGYCVPIYTVACTSDYIDDFSFHTLINNNSGCNGKERNYSNSPAILSSTTTVSKGKSYPISIQSGPRGQGFGVWIDYNNDYDFGDVGEFVYHTLTAGTGLYTGNITIPAGVSTGPKRLRVRSRRNTLISGAQSCEAFTNGETQDYTIHIEGPIASANPWNKRFGGSGTDNFSVVIKTSDGGYLLGGYSASGQSGDKSEASQGNNDFWIVKTDVLGNKLWDKRYGGSAADILNTAIQTSDGGYLLGGNSTSGISGDKTEAGRGGKDFWVIKITNAGVKQWDKRFGGSGEDDLRTLIQTEADAYLLGGYSNSAASGDKTQDAKGGQDYWIVKLNASGVKQFDKTFGGSADDFLEGVVETTDGGYILAGRSASSQSGDRSQSSKGGRDYWIVRTDGNGSKQWDKCFGGGGDDDLYAIGKGTDYFYLAGFSTSGVSGDKSQDTQGGKDFWMLKIAANGVKLWDKRFGGSDDEELRSIIQTTDGGYLLAGKSVSGVSGDKSQNSWGSSDYWIVKTDGNGSKQWDKRFGGTGAEELRTVLQTSDGGYLLGGRSDSGVSGDKTQTSQGGNDYWMVKVLADGQSIAPATRLAFESQVSELVNELSLKAAPNPFTEKITVSFTLLQSEQVMLKVYDSQGREVGHLYNGEADAGKHYEFEWSSGTHKSGLYVVQLSTASQVSYQKIILSR
ncbi:M6 family metalloprotease domain-containing protein [Rhodocytophaga rosea]|uniref:M6 family metalloprotease domain-containing protein n=1 Tax=Rhodocytophaga rosea TaxID=2704465 RepID=A0A6C0GGH8_9BACT|nr:M6 family metalloprotease domain-containing protein [Rhodocytophaga rosea]QHT66985.1 M6 family metalloprotease domain-containing protein [Rhodocytophaga rosea]